MTIFDEHNEKPEEISKSERKRQMHRLQALGEKLVTLSIDQLNKIPMDDVLKQAILEAKNISSHGGKRRQLQYIGKLMRSTDAEPIENAINSFELKSKQSKATFHQIERWRDKLIEEQDDTVQAFLAQYPKADRQRLRQLARNAMKKISGADTELFRYLREIIEKSK